MREPCNGKKSSTGQGLFSPEAAICLGGFPTLNHCVCFYALSGFVCTPQPLNVVGGTEDFNNNLEIVKPHRFLASRRKAHFPR